MSNEYPELDIYEHLRRMQQGFSEQMNRELLGQPMTAGRSIDTAMTASKLIDLMDELAPKLAEPRYSFKVNHMTKLVPKRSLKYHKRNRRWVKRFRRYGFNIAYMIPNDKMFFMPDMERLLMWGYEEGQKHLIIHMNPNTWNKLKSELVHIDDDDVSVGHIFGGIEVDL